MAVLYLFIYIFTKISVRQTYGLTTLLWYGETITTVHLLPLLWSRIDVREK